jgi:hypothetical protein
MTEENAAIVAAESLGYDVLQGILDELQQVPGFANLTQAQQQVHISRMDQRVRRLLAQALRIVFGAQYPACVGEIGPVTFGKSIRFRVEIEKSAESRHELADRTGQKVVLVMADPEQYYARMTEVRARADQKDLFHDPGQPLGHMGVDTPPDAPGGPGTGDFFAGGASGPVSEPVSETSPPPEQSGADSTPSEPSNVDEKREVIKLEEIDPNDIQAIVRALKARGIRVKAKGVSSWSQSQRVAACSWFDGRSSHRPDFIPAPTTEGEENAP